MSARATTRRRAPGLLCALVLCLAGCGGEGSQAGAAPARRPPRNVLLVSVDTLRADRLGCYGYERPTSPAIDALAAEGTRFAHAVATSPWTVPSHASLFTGLFPFSHGVVHESKRIGDELPSLTERLAAQGLRTAAFVNSRYLTPRIGFARGFERYEGFSDLSKTGGELTDAALAWLDAHHAEPFFLFLHYYEAHSDYAPDQRHRDLLVPPYDGPATGETSQLIAFRRGAVALDGDDMAHLSALYDAGVRQVDELLARVFARLRALGRWEDTLIVLTSDHGEEFGEHGGVLHGVTMHRELLDVPLILRGPGVPAGLVVEELATIADVLPTVLGRFDAAPEAPVDGVDLLGARERGRDLSDRIVYAGADHEGHVTDRRRMIRDGRYKLTVDVLEQTRALYDLAVDPDERDDVAAREAALADRLHAKLRAMMQHEREAEGGVTWSEEELEALRALGYTDE